MATFWVHELPSSQALPSPLLLCLLIFFCKAPPIYKLQLWLLINCCLRTGLVILTINRLISEGAFHLWVGNSNPMHRSILEKSLAPDGSSAASWNTLGTLFPLLPAQGTVSPATVSPVLPQPRDQTDPGNEKAPQPAEAPWHRVAVLEILISYAS